MNIIKKINEYTNNDNIDNKELESIIRDIENLNKHLNKLKMQFFRKRPGAKYGTEIYDILSGHEFLKFRNKNREASDLLEITSEI